MIKKKKRKDAAALSKERSEKAALQAPFCKATCCLDQFDGLGKVIADVSYCVHFNYLIEVTRIFVYRTNP